MRLDRANHASSRFHSGFITSSRACPILIAMKTRSVAFVLLLPALLLLAPLIAMQFTAEVAWTASDFVIAWVLLTGTGLAYKLVTDRARPLAYRAGAGLALITALAIVWGNLAVGFIGNEDHPANLLYFGVLATGVVGAAVARLEAAGMARASFATALAQLSVPVIAFAIWRPGFDAGVARVFLLNAGFAALFAIAAGLFRYSAHQHKIAANLATSA